MSGSVTPRAAVLGAGSWGTALSIHLGGLGREVTLCGRDRGLVDESRVRSISRTMALRKVAQPDDVARQVVVLASDELSGHVTGQVVTVAGGMEGRVVHE